MTGREDDEGRECTARGWEQAGLRGEGLGGVIHVYALMGANRTALLFSVVSSIRMGEKQAKTEIQGDLFKPKKKSFLTR